MALSPQLQQFKSSGVYRLEFDKSQTVNIPAETIRLVVGHSNKGPYNTPVLIENVEQFIQVFGSIDKNLERRGIFFHRSAIEALSRGPILCLNLTATVYNNDVEVDQAHNYSIVTNAANSQLGTTALFDSSGYSRLFDTEKFWNPKEEKLLNTVGTSGVMQNLALNFANIKQDPVTVIVKQAADTRGFELTAREWYGTGNVPEGIDELDYVSDYMVDVWVFKGLFDAQALNNDPTFGSYFNEDGLLVEKAQEFSNLREVTLLAQYTGSLIPDFMDNEGNLLYIQPIINAESRRTGLFCAVNEDAVQDGYIDLVGVNTDPVQDFEVLSHIVNQVPSQETVVTLGKVVNITDNEMEILDMSQVEFDAFNAEVFDGRYLLSSNSNEYGEITSVSYDAVNLIATVLVNGGGINSVYSSAPNTTAQISVYELGLNARTVEVPQTALLSDGVTTANWNFRYVGGGIIEFYAQVDNGEAAELTFSNDIKIGMYFATSGQEMSKIKQIIRSTETVNSLTSEVIYRFICHRDVDVEPTYAFKKFNQASSVYKMFPIQGATIADKNIADLLNMLRPGTGLANALADKDIITYRYLVDTFGSLENNTILNKEEFTLLAKERQNASAILNAPMVYELRECTNPSFTNELTGDFSTNYIASGGNLNLNPSALYTLPSTSEGASYGFYYGPGLNVIENGRTKIVPPAAYISNNYIDKYTDALPWSIIAGPRRGVVGGTGVQSVEYSFDKNDRDVLEPFGINPIVFERGVGLVIKGNKTAQQAVTSALSSAHVREVLIYIEDGLAEILRNYLFEFNTAQTRLEIKTLADAFMESVKKDQGVYDYRNIMDTSNNTNEVIDNNMGILDTFVEPVKGLEILVSRVTVLNTGEIATGNFS